LYPGKWNPGPGPPTPPPGNAGVEDVRGIEQGWFRKATLNSGWLPAVQRNWKLLDSGVPK
jgi:hypothetical protein